MEYRIVRVRMDWKMKKKRVEMKEEGKKTSLIRHVNNVWVDESITSCSVFYKEASLRPMILSSYLLVIFNGVRISMSLENRQNWRIIIHRSWSFNRSIIFRWLLMVVHGLAVFCLVLTPVTIVYVPYIVNCPVGRRSVGQYFFGCYWSSLGSPCLVLTPLTVSWLCLSSHSNN